MNDLDWVMYAGAAAWIGLGLYLFRLSLRQRELARRLARLESTMEKEQ